MTNQDNVANQMFEAAILVDFANCGQKKSMPDLEMYKQCSTELAWIANMIATIRSKGFGVDIQPNTFTK